MGGDGRGVRETKRYCWPTYHGVNMRNHLVRGDLTVLLQELPCRGDIFLDLVVVPRDELGVTVL